MLWNYYKRYSIICQNSMYTSAVVTSMYNNLKRPVFGVGINDSETLTKKRTTYRDKNGKKIEIILWECPYYRTWHDMIRRCYSSQSQKKRPSYNDCIVAEEWLTFSSFKRWMVSEKSTCVDFKGRKLALDKDILLEGNRVYSPNTCCFVSPTLNSFFLKGGGISNEYLMGVSRHKKDLHKGHSAPYIGRCSNPFHRYKGDNRWEFSKSFPTEVEAHNYWRSMKHMLAQKFLELPCTPIKVHEVLKNKWKGDYVEE